MVLAGGGIVILSVLLWLGLSADEANGTSRVSLVMAAILATVVFHQKKLIDWKFVNPLLATTIAGTLLGSFCGSSIDSRVMYGVIFFSSLLSVVLVLLKPQKWLSDRGTELSRHFA